MKKYIANAFSLQMVTAGMALATAEADIEEVRAAIDSGAESAIGHIDTAAVVSTMVGRQISANRINITLNEGDILYVAQLVGGRLPEGATTLPEGFTLKFIKVKPVQISWAGCTESACPLSELAWR